MSTTDDPDAANVRAQPHRAGHDPHDQRHDDDHHHDSHGHAHRTGVHGWVRKFFGPHSHNATDSLDDELAASTEGIRTVKISLMVLALTAIAQLGLVLLTSSVALLADTIHNFSDALTAVPLWVAFALARRAPSPRYTYGLGRVEDLAGLFIVATIALSAVVAGLEAVRRLLDPQPIEYVWVLFAAGLLGFAGNELVATYRIRVGRRIGSAALVADGLHARTDGFTSLAISIGAVGVMIGIPRADPIAGLIITGAILVALRTAARDVFRRLLDGIEPEFVDRAELALRGTEGVVTVRSLRMRWQGHQLLAEARIDVPADLDLRAAHALAHRAEHAIRRDVPKLSSVIVHVGPATTT